MSDGLRVLNSKIAMLRVVADIPDSAVPAVEATIDRETKRTIAAAQNAYGRAWPVKKVGGSDFSFVKASDIVTGSIGRTIITRIKTRVAVLHHLGYARGEVRRGVIPVDTIPPVMAREIKRTVVAEFDRIANGGAA